MTPFYRWIIAAAMAVTGLSAAAHEYQTPNFTVIHPWADATPAGQTDANIYFTVSGQTQGDQLIRGFSPIAERVEMRSGPGADGTDLTSIPVSVTRAEVSAPGGPILVLRGLKMPLRQKSSYPLMLEFEKAGIVNVMVSVGAH
jgi:periplasmic copper chaperone A